MSKIRVLPEQLANRIAAGEVVERPASVVKELLENSLDAGAGRIEIEIEGGGTRLIRVMDDGEGMDEDDILLCLERHGTSKIATDMDLVAINSLGFRGEAIPSIGSVSRMTITSRTAELPLGSRVVQDYGKLIKVHEIGCSRGTIFEVRNLFGNTPARRKFLRTSRTEMAHIEEVVKSYALAASATTFVLRVDGREVLHFAENQSLPDRLSVIMHYQGPLMKVEKDGDRGCQGWLLPPDANVTGSAGIRLLVNGRSVRDRMIVHAVVEGFRNFLMKGRGPAGLIHLCLPLADVDVNVHPTKQEIRLRDSQAVHQMVCQAVELAIRNYQKAIQTTVFLAVPAQEARAASEPKTTLPPRSLLSPQPFMTSPSLSAPLQTAERAIPDFPSLDQRFPVKQQPLPGTGDGSHGLKIIGQYDNLYIFCQSADGSLIVVDQHAAHERLLFEDLKRQFQQGHIVSQYLLFPVTIELSPAEAESVEQHRPEIQKMGFAIREFGGNSFVISAVPALAGQCKPEELLLDTLARFVGATGEKSGETRQGKGSRQDDILASMACKAAVKAGDRLHEREIDALLARMARADLFSHCPHGRPVLKQFTATEVKKWFHRS
jgi:DNA mismatch repair protein MutL